MHPPIPYISLGSIPSAVEAIGRDFHSLLFSLKEISESDFRERTLELREAATSLNLQSLKFSVDRLCHYRQHGISSINVGGTMGCGKSSVSEFVTTHLHFRLRDADYFHTNEARDKMSRGVPLSDSDRFPFLRSTAEWLRTPRTITTCSALTDLYRAILAGLDPKIAYATDDPRRSNPWSIENPNYGLLQIILLKPYDIALDELDRAFHHGPPRLFDGKPHFIQVSKESEQLAERSGKTPLLLSQYNLLHSNPPLPWEVLCIDALSIRDSSGEYTNSSALDGLLQLPFNAGPSTTI
jgi:hypothetical protein